MKRLGLLSSVCVSVRAGPALVTASVALGACIIPDRDIGIDDGPGNPGAVRIIERAEQPAEMLELCEADPAFCPQIERSLPSGLVRSSQGSFCICANGDNRALMPFRISVEDPDLEGDAPKDTLYGVLLLDPDPFSANPQAQVAYENYLDKGWQGVAVENPYGPDGVRSEARDEAFVRVFRIDDGSEQGRVDLCNNESGNQVAPGLHNLQFMVTDRPFFTPESPEASTQYGVPNLAVGATYAVINYVFECIDANTVEPEACDCKGEL